MPACCERKQRVVKSCFRSLNQKKVIHNICQQLSDSVCNIVGVMIESNIYEGNQPLVSKEDLQYGISITDACISFNETIQLLGALNKVK